MPARKGGFFLTTILTTINSLYFIFFAYYLPVRKKEKPPQTVDLQGFQLVEVAGFEPTTFWSRTYCVWDGNALFFKRFSR